MIVSQSTLLSNARITRAILRSDLAALRQRPLRFIDRLPTVAADDNEILMTWTSQVFAADFIAEDQKAPIYGAGQAELTTTAIPKAKLGIQVPEGILNRITSIAQNRQGPNDVSFVSSWEETIAGTLLRGIREHYNMLCCAMMLDSLVYARNDYQLTCNWRMPAALKATVSPLWTGTTGLPVTDILTMKETAQETYGITYDRMTIALADFTNMVKTDEFKGLIGGSSIINQPFAASAFNPRDQRMKAVAADLLGLSEIEFEDGLYNRQGANGAVTSSRNLPLGKVILSRTADDNNQSTWDLANAKVAEKSVADLTGFPNFPAQEFGPLAYYAPANVALDPPTLLAYGVVRAFPRKHIPEATAVLTVR